MAKPYWYNADPNGKGRGAGWYYHTCRGLFSKVGGQKGPIGGNLLSGTEVKVKAGIEAGLATAGVEISKKFKRSYW